MINNKLISGIFISFIVGIGALNLLVEDKTFSEEENRMLSQVPKLTIESFLSGDFTSDFEKYVNDQFVQKADWLQIKASSEQLLLKKEMNDIYLGDDGFLLEKFKKPEQSFVRNLEYMNYFAEKAEDVQTYFLLAPTSVEIFKEKLPPYAPNYSQEKVFDSTKHKLASSIHFIDSYEELMKRKKENIYFRTDHHWTMRGAYYAYKATAEAMGFQPYSLDDFTSKTVSRDFYGTFYSQVHVKNTKADNIEVFLPKFDVDYQVKYEDKTTTTSLYEWSYLDKKDQYSLFLNGNHSLIQINTSVKNDRKLLVIKDSYAHSLVPFLANHFEEIHVIDLRYFHSNVYTYIEEQNIDEALFMYNISTFSTDSNMVWLNQ